MSNKINFVIVSVIICIVAAYYLDTPLPDGFTTKFTDMWYIKTYLAVCKMGFGSPHLAKYLGFDLAETLQHAARVLGTVRFYKEYQDPTINKIETYFSNIFVTIFEPPEEDKTGRGLVYLPGGGWTIGDLGLHEDQLRRMAKVLGAVVIHINYRLAPKHKFPAAFDDCYDATKYFIQNAKKFGVDPERILVMGDSAGGNLAAVVSYHLKETQVYPLPKLQVLIYPVLQGHDLDTPSYRANEHGIFLTKGAMAFFFSTYLVGDEYRRHMSEFYNNEHTSKAEAIQVAKDFLSVQHLPKDDYVENYHVDVKQYKNETLWQMIRNNLRDPRFSPIFAKNLTGVSPAFILTCQFDVLRDDGFFFAKRLRDANVRTEHVNLYCFHTWNMLHFQVDMFDKYFRDMLSYIEQNV